MSKTLEAIRKLPHVAHVDDERGIGNSIIVTLRDAWCFNADPGCGVMGFDTVADAKVGTTRSAVYALSTAQEVA